MVITALAHRKRNKQVMYAKMLKRKFSNIANRWDTSGLENDLWKPRCSSYTLVKTFHVIYMGSIRISVVSFLFIPPKQLLEDVIWLDGKNKRWSWLSPIRMLDSMWNFKNKGYVRITNHLDHQIFELGNRVRPSRRCDLPSPT